MTKGERYLFGPVPSRRLGLSLGVDIVPFKVCSLDCVYCQLGRTNQKIIERKDYVSIDLVLAELKDRLVQGLKADFITISGSGEPTLNSRLGEFIDGVKEITDIPVAILTNGTLLCRKDVRADCAKADVVIPSLDAGFEETFQKINRPHKDISIEKLIDGLSAFRDEFAGQIWLEVFLIEGFNTDNRQIAEIKTAVEQIRPDKIQLNTAVRPTADANIKRVNAERLLVIAKRLGKKCEIISDLLARHQGNSIRNKDKDIQAFSSTICRAEALVSMLKRRPCSLNDICSGLGIQRDEVLKYVTRFQQQGVVHSSEKDGIIFFKAMS